MAEKNHSGEMIPPVLKMKVKNGNEYYTIPSIKKYRVCDSCYFERERGGCRCTFPEIRKTQCKSNGIDVIWRKVEN